MIRRSVQDLSKSVFFPLYGALLHASLFAKPHGRYQPFRANSNIRYNFGNWLSTPPLRKETAAAGPSFLTATTTSGRPDYRMQHIYGSLWRWSELAFFSLPLVAAFGDTSTRCSKVKATAEGEGRPFRWGLWNIWLSSQLLLLQLFRQNFQEKVGESVDRNHFPSSPMTEHSSPQSSNLPPPQTVRHPLTVPVPICNRTRWFVSLDCAGPL